MVMVPADDHTTTTAAGHKALAVPCSPQCKNRGRAIGPGRRERERERERSEARIKGGRMVSGE